MSIFPVDDGIGPALDRTLAVWHDGKLPGVVGVGTTWEPRGERVLLIGVEIERSPWPAPHLRRPPKWVVAAVRRLRLRGPRPPSIDALFPLLERADSTTQQELGDLELPPSTRVAYVTPLRLLADAGPRLLSATRETATVGLQLRADAGWFVTTAGHLKVGVGDIVQLALRRRPWSFRQRYVPGRMHSKTTPAEPDVDVGADRIDVALIEVEGPLPLLRRPLVEPAAALASYDELTWNGAVTGRRKGWVVASWIERGKPGTIPHRDCAVCLGYGGSGLEGDSGTAGFDHFGAFVGHLVAVEGYTTGNVAQAAVFQRGEHVLEYANRRLGSLDERESLH